jgi:hypothetical protein
MPCIRGLHRADMGRSVLRPYIFLCSDCVGSGVDEGLEGEMADVVGEGAEDGGAGESQDPGNDDLLAPDPADGVGSARGADSGDGAADGVSC